MDPPLVFLRLRLGEGGGYLTVWSITRFVYITYPWCAGVSAHNVYEIRGFDGTYTDGDGASRPLADRFGTKRLRGPRNSRGEYEYLRLAWVIDADALAPSSDALRDFADPRVQGFFYFGSACFCDGKFLAGPEETAVAVPPAVAPDDPVPIKRKDVEKMERRMIRCIKAP